MNSAPSLLDKPRLYVDLNEMVEADLVLLSVGDTKCDSSGATILLQEGLPIDVYMEDVNEAGRADPLIASGLVEATAGRGWAPQVKWCCRISPPGIEHLSASKSLIRRQDRPLAIDCFLGSSPSWKIR